MPVSCERTLCFVCRKRLEIREDLLSRRAKVEGDPKEIEGWEGLPKACQKAVKNGEECKVYISLGGEVGVKSTRNVSGE